MSPNCCPGLQPWFTISPRLLPTLQVVIFLKITLEGATHTLSWHGHAYLSALSQQRTPGTPPSSRPELLSGPWTSCLLCLEHIPSFVQSTKLTLIHFLFLRLGFLQEDGPDHHPVSPRSHLLEEMCFVRVPDACTIPAIAKITLQLLVYFLYPSTKL